MSRVFEKDTGSWKDFELSEKEKKKKDSSVFKYVDTLTQLPSHTVWVGLFSLIFIDS